MKYVIKVVSRAGISLNGGGPAPDGQYVKFYDPNAMEGYGLADFTPDPEVALQFNSHREALDFWNQQSTKMPLRADGRPNRPLTAYTVSVEPLKS